MRKLKRVEVIAKDSIGGVEYEFRVARIHDPDSPQMTHRVEVRRAGSDVEWESAMVGMAISRKGALRFFAERYTRVGQNIEDLEVFDEGLKGLVEEEIKAKRKRESEANKAEADRKLEEQERQEGLQRRKTNEEAIAVSMKKVRAKKVNIKIIVDFPTYEVEEIISALKIGGYAYHQDWNSETYGVTHVETGQRILGCLLRQEARELAYRMSLMLCKYPVPSEDFLREGKKIIDAFRNRDLIIGRK